MSAAENPRDPIAIKGSQLAIASPNSVAETSFCIPAVRALQDAHPRLGITIFASLETAPLWNLLPDFRVLVAASSTRKIIDQIAQRHPLLDAALVWEPSPVTLAFAKAKIRQILGPPAPELLKILTHPIEISRIPGPIEHQVQHYLLTIERLGAEPFQLQFFKTPPSSIDRDPSLVALSPGSDFGPAAEWPIERFTALARRLKPHFQLAILPALDHTAPAIQLAKNLNQPELYHALAGEELLTFLSRCRAMVANDGSLPHYAASVGTPCLTLFGPNEPEWKRPLGQIHRVLRKHVACSACLLNRCPLDHRCLEEISVDEVFADFGELVPSS